MGRTFDPAEQPGMSQPLASQIASGTLNDVVTKPIKGEIQKMASRREH
jgi:hypothetical protein